VGVLLTGGNGYIRPRKGLHKDMQGT